MPDIDKIIKEKIEKIMPLIEIILPNLPEGIVIKSKGSYDDVIDQLLSLFSSQREDLIRQFEGIIRKGESTAKAINKYQFNDIVTRNKLRAELRAKLREMKEVK